MVVSLAIPTYIASAANTSVAVTESSGWLESAYVEWSPVANAVGYNVYYKPANASDSSYVQLDTMLIRKYSNYWRADAVGLKAGNYVMRVIPIISGKEDATKGMTTTTLNVKAYDRTGFAWSNNTSVGTASGAYNDDGTLKSNAIVLYVTENTKNTVSADIKTSGSSTTTLTGIQSILDGLKKGYETRPVDVRVIGKVTTPSRSMAGDIMVDCNSKYKAGVTIEGIGEDAAAFGWGVRIKNASNVEVRNIGFLNCNSNEGDNVGLQQGNDHVWVHNCDMFYGDAGSDADQVKGDGALDCKKSTYITFSYNHFFDNGKCNLLGLSEGTTSGLYITYHHNWYDHSDSRHPRVRYYSAHVYNNYYDGNAKYGVGSTLGSSVFVENNYFRNCKYPMLTSMQGSDVFNMTTNKNDYANMATFSKENGGTIKSYGNVILGAARYVPYGSTTTDGSNSKVDFDCYEVSSASQTVPSSVKSAYGSNSYNNFDTSSVMYSYKADSAEAAKANVEKYAGRVNGGDFKWTFNNDVDDTSYAVNTALKSAVVNYKSSVVSIGGNSIKGTGTGSTPVEDPTQGTTVAPTQPTTQPTTQAPTIKPTVGPTESTTQAATTAPTDETDKSGVGTVTNLSKLTDANFKNAVYVSPTGKASNAGTKSSPKDLESAIDSASTSSAIILLGGTYSYNTQVTIKAGNNGTASAYKVLRAADNAKVVLDFSSQPYGDTASNARGLQIEGNYWYVNGITVKGAADNGIFVCGSNNIIERCILQGNRDTGLQIARRNSSLSSMSDWPANNYVINCTSFDSCDPATGENADGFAAKLTCANGNTFDGCISYSNCDDGWDLYAKVATGSIGVVTIKNCVAFNNGTLTNGDSTANGDMNGFKLGGSNGAVPTPHVVDNCLAFNNGKHGFTDNGNGGALKISNCTSFNNSKSNYAFDRTKNGVYTNLVSFKNNSSSTADKFVGKIQNSVYFTNGKYYYTGSVATAIGKSDKIGSTITVSNSAFKNVTAPSGTSTTIDATYRNADGTINLKGFMQSVDGSGCKFGTNASSTMTVKVNTTSTPEQPTTETPTKPTEGTTVAPTKPTVVPTKPTEGTTAEPTKPTVDPTPSTSGAVMNFTENGKSSDVFAVTGNLSTSKGSVSYEGMKLTTCLKMESSTNVTFENAKATTVTLVFNSAFNGSVKLDGESYKVTDGIVTIDIAAGSHKLTKGDSANLYYIALGSTGSASEDDTVSTASHSFTESGKDSDVFAITGNLSTSKGSVTFDGTKYTTCLKMESSTNITFTANANATLTLVFNSSFDGKVKVDGTSYTASNGVVTVDITAGSHKITKGVSANLYFIAITK